MDAMREKTYQMSDSFLVAALVALSGGAQDAYTFFGRGGVFANAQTGNVVLFSSNLVRGETVAALRYLYPVIAFLLGVFAAEHIRRRFRERPGFHWRQLVVLLEIVLLTAVGFLPQAWNGLANVLVSFVCAMQVQTFRTVCGNPYASTMCIGNLRSCMDALHSFVAEKDAKHLRRSLIYLGVIAFFGAGAGAGYLLTQQLGDGAIWFSCALLLCAFCMMLSGDEKNRREEILG